MYPAASIEEMVRFYRKDGGVVVSGMWSVLLATSPGQSADFARRYFEKFNSIVHGGWNLAVFAESRWDGNKREWFSSEKLHRISDHIRGALTEQKVVVPDLCIVFFDPREGEFNRRSVIVPLDPSRIGNEAQYHLGFEKTHQSILQSFKVLGLDPYARVPPDQSDALMEELSSQLAKLHYGALAVKVGAALVSALLGAIVGMPFSS